MNYANRISVKLLDYDGPLYVIAFTNHQWCITSSSVNYYDWSKLSYTRTHRALFTNVFSW